MIFESKKILIASAILNIVMIISCTYLAVHCTGKYYTLHKKITEQNKIISGQTDYEKVNILFSKIFIDKYNVQTNYFIYY